MVALSERELVPIYKVLAARGAWGGNEQTLLGQAEVYEVLRLSRFAALERATLPSLSAELTEYDLSANAVDILRRALAAPGQDMVLGLLSAGALRRLAGGP